MALNPVGSSSLFRPRFSHDLTSLGRKRQCAPTTPIFKAGIVPFCAILRTQSLEHLSRAARSFHVQKGLYSSDFSARHCALPFSPKLAQRFEGKREALSYCHWAPRAFLINFAGGFDYTGADCMGWMHEAGQPR